MARLSGPLLDRIDQHLEVPSVPFEDLSKIQDGTSSATMRADVLKARDIQHKRFAHDPGRINGRMTPRQIRQYCQLDSESLAVLGDAMRDLGLSARAHDRILRMARTIADLAGVDSIQVDHLAEALGYRTLDRKLWKS